MHTDSASNHYEGVASTPPAIGNNSVMLPSVLVFFNNPTWTAQDWTYITPPPPPGLLQQSHLNSSGLNLYSPPPPPPHLLQQPPTEQLKIKPQPTPSLTHQSVTKHCLQVPLLTAILTLVPAFIITLQVPHTFNTVSCSSKETSWDIMHILINANSTTINDKNFSKWHVPVLALAVCCNVHCPTYLLSPWPCA